jgi:ParB family chromosome partitioning protein
MNTKFKGLGKGLSALMGDTNDLKSQESKDLNKVPIEFIQPNPDQPRKIFDKNSLEDLSQSIKAQGIIQPIIVRKKGLNNYEIVAGERRWRASQLAKIHEVPVVIKDIDDKTALEFAIIENVQRSDLNAIEESNGYKNLIERYNYTQDQLADVVGKSRSHIANTIRLSSLPNEIQDMVKNNLLSAGHARCLINVPNNVELAKEIISKNLTVRQSEVLSKKYQFSNVKKFKVINKDANLNALQEDLESSLGLKVKINNKKNNKGGISFYYNNLEQLNKIITTLKSFFK